MVDPSSICWKSNSVGGCKTNQNQPHVIKLLFVQIWRLVTQREVGYSPRICDSHLLLGWLTAILIVFIYAFKKFHTHHCS